MPGLITNYMFGERSFQLLSPNYLKEIIRNNTNSFRMGLQGPDIFNYYLNVNGQKYQHHITKILKKRNTHCFIDNMLDYISIMDTSDKDICLAYIAGFLCHHALDIHIDPYLRYRMYKDIEADPSLSRDNFYYRRLETLIDTILLKRLNHMEPSQLNLEALVSLNKRERKHICDCLLYGLRTTYNYRLSRKSLLKVIASVKKTCIFLQTNPQMHIQMVNFFKNRLHLSSARSSLIYPEYTGDPFDYMNENRSDWYIPHDKEPHSESFIDLLDLADIYINKVLETFDDYLAWHGSRDELLMIISSPSFYNTKS